MMRTSMQITTRLSGDLKALEAICPLCGRKVRCEYGDDDSLIWWLNKGEQCSHFRGMYAGAGVKVAAHFEG